MAGAPRAVSRFGFRGFISVTRKVARGVTDMVVGSGALLGDGAKPIELATTSDPQSLDGRPKTCLPIRRIELPEMPAGQEPFTLTATHALALAFSLIIANRELPNRSGRT